MQRKKSEYIGQSMLNWGRRKRWRPQRRFMDVKEEMQRVGVAEEDPRDRMRQTKCHGTWVVDPVFWVCFLLYCESLLSCVCQVYFWFLCFISQPCSHLLPILLLSCLFKNSVGLCFWSRCRHFLVCTHSVYFNRLLTQLQLIKTVSIPSWPAESCIWVLSLHSHTPDCDRKIL